ncbi:phospholipase D-like domain-containing protein [Haladaptatus sp. CMSO5]|uniref:phospholipase D-like domain-containing protein n=1 Tax=Haladaptatus sp. CMSO5 TaxID=3120514 RepID=UPI002FCE3045
MALSLPDELTNHGKGDVWGVTPSALTLAANARQTGEWSAVRRYYDLHVLVTNYEPNWEKYKRTLEKLCSRWLSSPLDQATAFCTPESAATFFAGTAYFDVPSGIANVLVAGQDVVKRTEPGNTAVMRRNDVIGYTDSDIDISLLRSLDVIRPIANGFQLNRNVFQELQVSFEKSRSEAAATLLVGLLETRGVAQPSRLVDPLLRAFGVDPPESPVTNTGALSVLLRNKALDGFAESLFDEEFDTIVDEVQKETHDELRRLESARGMGSWTSETPTSIVWPIPEPEAGVCAIVSQRKLPLDADWLNQRLDSPVLALVDDLTEAGIAVTYQNGLLKFEQAYQEPPDVVPALESYSDWLSSQSQIFQERREAIAEVRSNVDQRWEQQRDAVLSVALETLEDWTVSPTRFVYTIFDPTHHADQYDIEKYVGPSDDLKREVELIRQWREQRPSDTESFAELVPEVLNFPLEHDAVEGVVRIMCPWTNFAVQDYTALFTRLFDNDVNVRLLMRLPTSNEWRNLKSNLLSRIGNTNGNLEIRSYTRYREFMDHNELRELDAQIEQRRRTGVHAKLFIAGSPRNGNMLAGSANLMENSFFYNPEAGIQTRNPGAIKGAIEYFDLVWKIAAPDRIPEEAFTGDTEFRFYPRVYQPR